MADMGRARTGARTVAASVVAIGLLVSCSTGAVEPEAAGSGSTRTTAATPSGPAATPGGHPAVPSKDAAALARQLEESASTVRDRAAAPDDVRRAGELQQLAVLELATARPSFRSRVLARLDPATSRATRNQVHAARLLRAMTTPQDELPRWRIVAPPPATRLLRHYREAQRRTGVPWTYLAAIHLVETRMGRIRGTSPAGAQGPMQFMPATWEVYGGGGDIDDPRDAVLAAARLLKAHGAPADMEKALWHYNQSDSYVQAVSEYAHTMRRSSAAYRGYWHWRVLYRHERGTYVLPVGYPRTRPVLLPER